MNQTETSKSQPDGSARFAPTGLFCCVRDLCEAIWKAFCPPKRKRLELRFLPYDEADKLIRETNGAWTIAKEEDTNRRIGMVYLERLEEHPHFEKQQNARTEPRRERDESKT